MENNNQKQESKPKYVNGEKYTYNRFEDTFGDAGRYSDETPRNEPFHIFKVIPNGGKKKKVFIAILVIFGLLTIVGGVLGFLSVNGLI